jgi:hypothetical protein
MVTEQVMIEAAAATAAATSRFIKTTLLLKEGTTPSTVAVAAPFNLNKDCLRLTPDASFFFNISSTTAQTTSKRKLLQGLGTSSFTLGSSSTW